MDSLTFSACYAFPPNSHGYCGASSFSKILTGCLAGRNSSILEKELRKFRVQYAYLSLIARENNLKPFNRKVVHAFWIGNSLLENVSHKSMKDFLVSELFPKNSIKGKNLAQNLPEGLNPHHSFNALYVHFVTDKVKKSIQNFDSCCITSGKILSLSDKSAKVDRFSISWKNGFLLKNKICKIDLVRNGVWLIKPRIGDRIAIHWGMAVDKLTEKDEKLLIKYTQKNMDALNNMFKK
ncbi:Uncharacterised protein [Candidatus Bilamarchaeum dharawalense]|uniref:Uncharacterized protein n=1 Tax=Candidatus Bilamarchaeum dharawalense TaxID=2885759 RepID=A0A5E4LPR1_9ARCH|nr:Uncharacterised protein [Candidatus Bilamarchaeum dharawalense]